MIYAHANATRLAVVRIVVFAVCWLETACDPFPELAVLPRAWFVGHGPWALVPDVLLELLWRASSLWTLKLLTLGVIVLAAIGAPRARLWAALSSLLLTLTLSFVRGFGHADHSGLQLLMTTYVLAFTPAWDALAWQRETRLAPVANEYRAAFVALAVVFGFPYFLTAAARLAQEGFAIFVGHSMRHFLVRDTLALDDYDSTLGLALRGPLVVALLNLSFFVVTAAELASPFVHLNRRWTLAWLVLVIPFHVLSPLLMHVLFAPNLVLIALLYVWPLGFREGAGET